MSDPWVTQDNLVFNGFDGTPIVKGDRIVLAVRDGNCAGIRIGTVVGVKHRMITARKSREPYPRVPAPEVKVRVHVTKASGYWGEHEYDTWASPALMVRAPVPPPTRHYATGYDVMPSVTTFAGRRERNGQN